MRLTFHYDAGHGWLEVPTACLIDYGLMTTDFSRFSYKNGANVYLEEDCDTQKFLAAVNCAGDAPRIAEVWDGNTSPIRNYARLQG